jgi:uncharacterized protein
MSDQIYLRLYEELNDFLPASRRNRRFACPLNGVNTIEELLQALNVPCMEVELVLVNGDSVEFTHCLRVGDFVSIYPVFESLDVSSVVRVRENTLRQTRFLMGTGLTRLGFYLRRLGFDVLDSDSWPLEQVIRISEGERRLFLTKDPDLSKCPEFSRVFLVREKTPKRQLLEVLARLDLPHSIERETGNGKL